MVGIQKMHIPREYKKPCLMPAPYFNGVAGKRTKKAIRDEGQSGREVKEKAGSARLRRKAHEERKRKRDEVDPEQPDFDDDEGGWLD
ncbi:hypothetical protein LIPSTDRAFT_76779 [Lipomyces starkeyi NRRL Y-11557]|uniref:Uncharacterized protein n=1 Tax=Lipomyces starkeyi NRRL Y-11557 TaxID=675824 RepID=A0A1E3PTK4_LIPST|nr:hypothetical protein LIPSTDRAFT_76779 [Lipomyces starkeyi NRRL Y-11557]